MCQFKKHSDMRDKLKRNSHIPALKSLCAVREAKKISTERSKLKTSITQFREISNLWEGLKHNIKSLTNSPNSPTKKQKQNSHVQVTKCRAAKSPLNNKTQTSKTIYRANIDLTIKTVSHPKHQRINSGNDIRQYDEECLNDLEILNKAALDKDNAIKYYEALKQKFLGKYLHKHQQLNKFINK